MEIYRFSEYPCIKYDYSRHYKCYLDVGFKVSEMLYGGTEVYPGSCETIERAGKCRVAISSGRYPVCRFAAAELAAFVILSVRSYCKHQAA